MCPRGGSLSLHSMQVCPLLLNVRVCVIFVFQKAEEGPGPLRSSSGSTTAVLKILVSCYFENSKFLKSFLLFISIEDDG